MTDAHKVKMHRRAERPYSSLTRPPDTQINVQSGEVEAPKRKGAAKFLDRVQQFIGYEHDARGGTLLAGEHLTITDAGLDVHGNAVFRVARRCGPNLDHGGSEFAYPDELGMKMKAKWQGKHDARPLPDGIGFRSRAFPKGREREVRLTTRDIAQALVTAGQEFILWRAD